MKLTTASGGIVYRHDETGVAIVLLQRHDGLWVLPKGHCKASDGSLEESALREISEETGLDTEQLVVEQKLGSYVDRAFADQGEEKTVHIFQIRDV